MTERVPAAVGQRYRETPIFKLGQRVQHHPAEQSGLAEPQA